MSLVCINGCMACQDDYEVEDEDVANTEMPG